MPVAVIVTEGRNVGPVIFRNVGETHEVTADALNPNSSIVIRATMTEKTVAGGTINFELPCKRVISVDNNVVNAQITPASKVLGYNEKDPFNYK